MKTYVKLETKNKKKALKALRKLAVDTPKICIMDTGIKEDLGWSATTGAGQGGIPGAGGSGSLGSIEMVMNYFGGPEVISKERCQSIVSTSGVDLGDNDFVYEWADKPASGQVELLEEDIAKTLKPLGVKYTIKSK